MADHNDLISEGKKIAGHGKEWLSTASTSTLLITGGVILLVLVTGVWKSILTLVLIAALGTIAYFAVVSWQKSKNQEKSEPTFVNDGRNTVIDHQER